jgi:glycosyltransferase involved in cell wall biosynthesis
LQAEVRITPLQNREEAVAPRPKLSVCVPFYNEEESITPLHAAVVEALEPLGVPFEMVFVDDGSRDGTLRIVVGWRHDRQDKLISRKIPSRIANRLIARVTGVAIRDNGCSLKAYRASLIKRIPLYSEMHRFIPAVASIAGPRIAEIKVRHHARKFGKSKYGLSRVYKVLLDLMVIKTVASFASRPLLWFGMLSLPLMAVATLALGYSLFDALANDRPLSLPVAGTGIIFLTSAFILICAGALGELTYKLGDLRDQEFSALTQRLGLRSGPLGKIDSIRGSSR